MITTAAISFLKRWRNYAHQDPVRDWLALLTVAIIVLMGIIVWNAWAFDTVASGGTIGAPPPAASTTFNRSVLDTIHTTFEKRAVEKAKYVSGIYRYIDPSQ